MSRTTGKKQEVQNGMEEFYGMTPDLRLMYLKQRQALPLSIKISMTLNRIRQWYEYHNGQVYVSFSGGKDSTVLLNLVRSIYPEVPAVFADTGLEYPEIRAFVKTIDNVIWLKPKMNFKNVLNYSGYPVVSKKVSRMIRDCQNPTEANKASVSLYMTGFKKNGEKGHHSFKLPKKWKYLIDAPFKISNKCCDLMKKEPFHRYFKETKRYTFAGVLASDSQQREFSYLQVGCNAFSTGVSNPLAFWTEQDILQYLLQNKIEYCCIYGSIVKNRKGILTTTKEKRTGCIFCLFGIHLEKGVNRLQRLSVTHPDLHKYCMEDLGLQKVCDFMKIPTVQTGLFF